MLRIQEKAHIHKDKLAQEFCMPGQPFPELTSNTPADYGASRLLYLHTDYFQGLKLVNTEHLPLPNLH